MATKNPTGDREKVVAQIIALRQQGLGYPRIAKQLNEEGVATFGGGTWYAPVVRGICVKHFGSAAESLKAAGTSYGSGARAANEARRKAVPDAGAAQAKRTTRARRRTAK
jgi:hypothetical protein